MALLSGAAALFIVKAMSSIEVNESLQAAIGLTTVVRLCLGKRWHLVQAFLYLAIQTLVVVTLLESCQVRLSLHAVSFANPP